MTSTDPVRRGRGNLVALALTRAAIVASGLVANLALIEWLPRETFGVYRLIWSTIVLCTFGANLGLGHHVNREVAREPGRAAGLVRDGLATSLILSTATGLALCGWFAWSRPGEPEVIAAAIFGAATLAMNAMSQIPQGALHGAGRMFLELPAVLASRVIFATSQVVLAAAGAGLVALYAGRFAAASVLAVGLMWQARRTFGPPATPLRSDAVRGLVRTGRVFGATVLFSAISAQSDIVMLGFFSTDVEVARYGAPAVVLLQLVFIANIFSRGVFPQLARLVGDRDGAGEVLTFLLRILWVVSVPIAVGGVVLAGPLIGLLKGGAYLDAAGVFTLLLVAVPVRFASNGLGFALTALDRQGARARLDMVGAVVNVGLNLYAIPRYGAEGAAATTLITDLLLLGLVAIQVREVATLGGLMAGLVRVVAASGLMASAVLAVPGAPVLARVLLGAVVYLVASGLIGAWRPADLKRLRRV